MTTVRSSYTVDVLQQYRNDITTNGVSGAINFYTNLSNNGYGYAGWANGVAQNNTTTGISATGFLTSTAMMGVGGEQCKSLTNSQLNQIKTDMALGYVDALIANARQNGGSTSQDVTYKQTKDFHQTAFEKNGLSIDNWTLKTPMDIIEKQQGEKAVEDKWQNIRDTNGDWYDAVLESLSLYWLVSETACYPNEMTEQAKEWLKYAPGAHSQESFEISWDLSKDVLAELLDELTEMPQWAKDLANKTYRIEYYDPLALDLNGDGAITTLAEANSAGALFDHDGDGIRTATGWIAPQDGILVRDINGNGIIDNGKELFGDNTILKNGQKAISGMAALADLDSNSDGIIDDKDEAFNSLKVWQDKNSNRFLEQVA